MFIVSRPGPRHTVHYATGADHLGAFWDTTAKPVTKREVALIVAHAADPYELQIRRADNWLESIELREITGYIGQDENDEAIYDDDAAWINATA